MCWSRRSHPPRKPRRHGQRRRTRLRGAERGSRGRGATSVVWRSCAGPAAELRPTPPAVCIDAAYSYRGPAFRMKVFQLFYFLYITCHPLRMLEGLKLVVVKINLLDWQHTYNRLQQQDCKLESSVPIHHCTTSGTSQLLI